MNRFTKWFDNMNFRQHGFTDVGYLLFPENGNALFWAETYDTVYERDSKEIYREILPLFCSLLANLTDEEIDEYIDSFSV